MLELTVYLIRRYNENKSIRFKTPIPMLISELCDYADVYILVNGTITVTSQGNVIRDKKIDH